MLWLCVMRLSVVRLSVVCVLDTFLLISHGIHGMGNLFRNLSILESTGSSHSFRDGLSKTIGTKSGVLFVCRYIRRTCLWWFVEWCFRKITSNIFLPCFPWNEIFLRFLIMNPKNCILIACDRCRLIVLLLMLEDVVLSVHTGLWVVQLF